MVMTPRNHATLLLGTAVIFWGWQTGWLYLAALPGGSLIVLSMNRRKTTISPETYQKIAHISIVISIAVIVWSLFLQKDEIYVMALLRLSPLIWMPLVLIIALDSATRLAPDIFFSKNKTPVKKTKSHGLPKENWFYWFFFAAILAAGAAQNPHAWFFPGAALLTALVIEPWRVRQVGRLRWFLLLALAVAMGYQLQNGLFSLQRSLMYHLPQYLDQWFFKSKEDTNRMQTDIGRVGPLSLSGRILFRIFHENPLSRPLLLSESSYDFYQDGGWNQTRSTFFSIPPASPAHAWVLDEQNPIGEQTQRVIMHLTMASEQGLLLLPAHALRIENLDVTLLEKNRFGSVRYRHGAPGQPWSIIYAPHGNASVQNHEFTETDLLIPRAEKNGIDQVFKEAQWDGLSKEQVIEGLHRYFLEHFQYSLNLADHSRFSTPLTAFLLGSKRGHCEYFATASTLLLRRAGIPARYVFGYAVSEPDSQKGWYLARQRNAHAWTSVFINGKWRNEDFTPPDWLQKVNNDLTAWQSMLDLFDAARYTVSQWIQSWTQEMRLAIPGIGLLGLGVFYFYRKSNQKGLRKGNPRFRENTENTTSPGTAGTRSPFGAIITHLERTGTARHPAEPLSAWILERQRPELLDLLRHHYQWRFDPMGMSEHKAHRFKQEVAAWLQQEKNLHRSD